MSTGDTLNPGNDENVGNEESLDRACRQYDRVLREARLLVVMSPYF
jgi:hypothetical protein